MEKEPKIPFVELVIMAVLTSSFDITEIFLNILSLIPYVGPIFNILNLLSGWLIWFIVQFWLIIKGVRSGWYSAGSIIEMIPFINILPVRTLTLLMTYIIENNKDKIPGMEQMGKMGKTASKI